MREEIERGLITGKTSSDKSASSEFRRSLAIVIGIDKYSNSIPPLSTAVNDARELARILKDEHKYEVILLTNEAATLSRLKEVFTKDLLGKLAKNDRLLVYFAGHGVATDGDNGPAGFLIPQDATLEEKTFWPMTDLHKALDKLECRHMLAILDCCFAGAFRWSSKRDFQPLPPVIYKERYERFIRSAAWQVITSAAYDQKALDVLSGRVLSEQEDAQQQKRQHSPFAQALFDALAGAADTTPKDGDGVITATELYLYLRDEVEIPAEKLADHRQSPGLWPLNRHEHGEFIFLVPNCELNLPPAPDLTKENNPYKGLSSYEKGDSKLFFGRTALIEKLKQQVEKQPFTVVLGASGTGKSSLVKAGLLPALEKETEDGDASQASSWFILEKEVERDGKKKKRVMRPGSNPPATLRSLLIKALPGVRPEREKGSTPAGLIGQWRKKNPGQKLLLVIDQFEELITLCREEQAREDFIRELMQVLEEHSDVLRIVLTLRSDFEAQISQNYLKDWWQQDSRFVVPPMTQDELREVIEQPASVMVLYFEPHELIDDLINEVIQTPGALPLLSFTLSELYLRYVERQDGNRALTEADHKEIGGVIGSLRRRINQEYEQLDAAHQATMKRILLRMIAFEGGELTRRRVSKWELDYPDAAENERVKEVIDILFQARLIVTGSSENAGGKTESYIEPAHDALIVAWDKLRKWRADEEEAMLLQRQLTRAAADWEGSAGKKEKKGLLWDNNPRLGRAQEILQEKRLGRRLAEKKQGLFLWLKQFWRVLLPSFEDIEQAVWLNRVETAFVRRSVERKRNWTWSITGIVSVVIVALTIAAISISIEKNNAAVQAERAEKRKREVISANYTAQTSFVGNNILKAKWFQAEQGLRDFDSIKKSLSSYELPYLWRLCNKNFIELDSGNAVGTVFMPRGKSLLTGNVNNKLIQWDTLTGSQKWSHDAHEEGVLKGIKDIDYCLKTNEVATAGDGDSKIKVWNPENGSLKHTISLENIGWRRNVAMRIQYSLDGSKIAVLLQPDQRNPASGMSTLMYIPWQAAVLDAKTGRKIFASEMDARTMAISPDGKVLAAGAGRDINLYLIDAADKYTPSTIKLVRDYASALAFSPDGNQLAIGGNDVSLWDIKENRLAAFFKGHSERILDLAFSPDGELIASSSQDSTANLWNIKQLAEINTAIGHHAAIRSIIFSDDSKLLATASADGTTRIWDIDEQRNKWVTNGSAVDFSKDKELMVTWDDSMRIGRVVANDATNTIKIVDTVTWREYASGKFSDVDQAIFSPIKNILALGSNDKWHLFDTKQMKNVTEISAVQGGSKGPIGLFHPERENFFIIDKKNNLVELNISTGKTIQRIAANLFSEPKSAIFLHKGKFLAVGDQLKILFFNTEDWKLTKEVAVTGFASATSSYKHMKAESDSVNSIAVSSDGKLLLAINESGNATLWDTSILPDISKVKEIGQDERYNSWDSFVFAPDNSALALVKSNQSIDVWNLKELTIPPIRLIGHAGAVRSVDFSPDSKRIVTGDSDQTIKIWDAQTGRELLSLDSEVGPVLSVRFSPRGDAVISTHWQDDYRRVSVWKTASDARIHVETRPTEERRKFYDEAAKIREYILKSPDGKNLPDASKVHRQYVAEQLLREAVFETSLTQQDYSQSITKARAAIALYPDLTNNPEEFLFRFSLISAKKNKSKALELIERASELSDGSGEEDLSEAIALSNEALSLYPQFSDGYLKRGIALFRSGDVKGAEEDWLKTIELGAASPFDLRIVKDGFESANYNLACIYSIKSSKTSVKDERSRYIDKAINYLETALKGGVAVNNALHDSDLDAIRDDPRFEALLKQFRTN